MQLRTRIGTSRRYGAVLVAAGLLAVSCGEDPSAQVRVEPSGQQEQPDASTPATSASAADETPDEVEPVESRRSGLSGDSVDDIALQRVIVPYVPSITLPDLSILGRSDSIVQNALGDFAGPESGIDLVRAECEAASGELVYSGSDSASSFLDVDGFDGLDVKALDDGSGSYDFSGLGESLQVVVGDDGSGTYNRSEIGESVNISVNADGSGTYQYSGIGQQVEVVVDAVGSGSYQRSSPGESVTINIDSDGAGSYNRSSLGESVDITVNADGSGLFENFSEGRSVRLEGNSDGSRFYKFSGVGEGFELTVNADGSGIYERSGIGESAEISVASDGSGLYRRFEIGRSVEVAFTTDIGILDPGLVEVAPEPAFVVADRFPPLAKLGGLRPPCATVVRLDASVLFDFDSDRLRPEASAAVAQVAAALSSSGKSLQVHGHTDSKGDDAYNQDLSERRASSFAAALVAQGVATDVTSSGFGETRPVAANETADGADDPAGRQLNRRIEIVVPD